MKLFLFIVLALALLSAKANTDWIKCAEEALQLVSDVDQLVKDSVTKNVQIIVKDLQTILEDLDKMKILCGIAIPKIELNMDENIDWIKCAKDAADITELVLKLEKDAATMNVPAVIKDLQDILAKINDLKKDCGLSFDISEFNLENIDWIKCAKDAADITELVLKLEKDAATMNVPAVIKDLQDILAKINDLKKDCGLSFELPALTNAANTDWIKCAEEALQVVSDVDQLVKDAQTKDIQLIIKDLETILNDIDVLKQQCGIALPEIQFTAVDSIDWIKCAKDAADITELVLKLEKDAAIMDIPGIIKCLNDILAKINDMKKDCDLSFETPKLSLENVDWIKCAKDAADITELVLKLEKDAAIMDIPGVIKCLNEILAKINDMKKDCGLSFEVPKLGLENIDWIKCAKDAADITELVLKLEKDAATMNVPAVIKDLQDILAKINDLKKDCGLSLELSMNWAQCGKDAVQIADLVNQLVVDSKNEDYMKIMQDLQALLAEVQKLKTDCGVGIDFQVDYVNTDWIKCAKDGIQLVDDVDKLIKDAGSQDIPKIIQDLEKILSDLNIMKTDCGIKEFNYRPINTNWVLCAKDGVDLIQLVQKLVSDGAAKNVQAVMQDLNDISKEIPKMKTDCGI